jgi:hypothetical protein
MSPEQADPRPAAQTPKFREVANAIVLSGEAIISDQMTPLQSKRRLAGVLERFFYQVTLRSSLPSHAKLSSIAVQDD